jgi:renalase
VSGSASRPVVVVGAGISGIACARALDSAAVPVRVYDRGRRIGGRMAVRTEQVGGVRHPVDIGASYFTVRDPRFRQVADRWREAGLASPWTDTFDLVTPDGRSGTTTGAPRWSARLGLRSLVESLAEGLDVISEHEVGSVTVNGRALSVDDAPAPAVVLAMPDPQAGDLLDPSVANALDLDGGGQDWSPSIAVWAGWETAWWAQLDGAFVDGSPTVAWVADDGRRRGDGAAVLVAHATAGFAAGRLDDPVSAAAPILDELWRLLGPRRAGGSAAAQPPEPLWLRAHRWSLAAPLRPHPEPFAVTPSLVGVCGDAWGPRPRVEQAWLSGHLLGLELASLLA